MEIAKTELIEKLNNNTICNRNAVYDSARASIINNLQDCDDTVDIDNLYSDLSNTSGGSWLIYTQDIIDYFAKNYNDIDEVLDLDQEPIDLNSCSSVIDVITTLVYSAYEIALNHVLYL